MKNIITLTLALLFVSLGYSQTIRLGADRQKITTFELQGVNLNIQIENDVLRTVDLSSLLSTGTGTGNVTKVGTPLQQQIGVWTGDGTLGGSENFKFNGNTQIINSPASDKIRLTGSANPRIDLWGNGFAGLVIAKDDGARRVTYETNAYNGTDETWDLVFNEFGGRIQRWNTNAITSLKPHNFSAGASVTGNVTTTGNFIGNGSQLTNLTIPDNSITTAKIVDGTIVEADLAFTVGGSANPDIFWANRANGDITNDWAVTTGEEDKKVVNTTLSNISYYRIGAEYTLQKEIPLQSVLVKSALVVVPKTSYAIRGNGTEYIDTGISSDDIIGVFVDSTNSGSLAPMPPAIVNTFLVRGFVKPYVLPRPTNITTSNITATGFTVSWNAPTTSLGTVIGRFDISLDGATPIRVTGTSYTFTGLTAGTAYNVNVRPVDLGDNVGRYTADLGVSTTVSFFAANAATPTPNEVNGVVGVTSNATDFTIASVTSPVTNGSNAIRLTRNIANSVEAKAYLQYQNLNIGQSYTFTFDIQITSATAGNNNYISTTTIAVASDWDVTNIVEFGTGNYGNFETRSLTMTPNVANPRIAIVSSVNSQNVIGQITVIDNIIVTPN